MGGGVVRVEGGGGRRRMAPCLLRALFPFNTCGQLHQHYKVTPGLNNAALHFAESRLGFSI